MPASTRARRSAWPTCRSASRPRSKASSSSAERRGFGMADGSGSVQQLRIVERIGETAAGVWDHCAGTKNPFLSHAFLNALEVSGSATARTGWLPQHLIAEDGEGRVLGIVPLYLKSHSYGEDLFDHGWADPSPPPGRGDQPKPQVPAPFPPGPRTRPPLAPGADPARAGIRT